MNVKRLSAFLLAICVSLMASVTASRAETLQIVGFGDSLMAGYQLDAAYAFPVRLEAALKERGHDVVIANAGVSGDTSSAGLSRLDWSVPDGTDAVILELGANDMLRGIDPARTEANIDEMITRLKARDIEVLLAGMMASPNMGADFAERFNGLFESLAAKHDLVFYPFFLDGVAADAALNLDDGIHPNEDGIDVMVERFIPAAEELLQRLKPDA
ncbi:arylesterase [Rhizobium sp. EC-SD404]|uniref:arylesterase n=1 Tax=Rhizobium sp. EC-SD404 TaxID=2038389 RepID=UPI0012586905|nr:arylesterase [Rhizobium sp. EC-SD404]VVT00323.1 Arylesterase [Rhizobium sp. EC-SD404]